MRVTTAPECGYMSVVIEIGLVAMTGPVFYYGVQHMQSHP